MEQKTPLPVLGMALAVVIGLLVLIRHGGYLQQAELAAYDLLVALATRDAVLPPPVAVVEVTEADIQALGNWPLTDAQLARALEQLFKGGPRVIGLDLYRDLPVPPGTSELDRVLRSDHRVIGIEKFPSLGEPGVPPPPALVGTERIGFSDVLVDPGGVVRRNLLFQSFDDRVGYSFGLRLALAYLLAEGIVPKPADSDPAVLRLGSVELPPLRGDEGGYAGADAAGYQILLDYVGGPSPFPRYSLTDLYGGRVGREQIEDRIVVLGVASASVKDQLAVPHMRFGTGAGLVSGVTLHGQSAWQLIEAALVARSPIRTVPGVLELAWTVCWTGLGLWAGWSARSVPRFLGIVVLGGGTLLAAVTLAFLGGWWIPVVPPLLGGIAATVIGAGFAGVHSRRERRLLMGLFARQVSPAVAQAIWEQRQEVLQNGRLKPNVLQATVLFADLQGFTSVSEEMAPQEFLAWLNSYLGAMTDVILRFGGVLDDYAGDGIKADFGVPFARKGAAEVAADAEQAVLCALAMAAELIRLNREWVVRGRRPVGMRIGVHTGIVVAGTVGSPQRMKYTTLGSDVNLASRLESLRDLPGPDAAVEAASCRILASAETVSLLGNVFHKRALGKFPLRGIAREVEIFAVESAPNRGKTEERIDATRMHSRV